jgi:hypothetical protein
MIARPWSPPRRVIAIDGESMDPSAASRLAAREQPDAVLIRPSVRARATLAALPGIPVVAVLPDLTQLLRDVADRGAPRAAGSRLAAGGVSACWRIARTGLRHLTGLARQDFRAIVPVLIDLERGRAGRATPEGVAVAAPITDLLLAAGYAECLAHLVSFLRGSGTRAGFETHNLGHLLASLASWNVVPDFVIGPLNARGFRMKPTPSAVLAAIAQTVIPVLASELTAAGAVPLADGVAYARQHGAAGVIVPADELTQRMS